jgi:hypothetical protein
MGLACKLSQLGVQHGRIGHMRANLAAKAGRFRSMAKRPNAVEQRRGQGDGRPGLGAYLPFLSFGQFPVPCVRVFTRQR